MTSLECDDLSSPLVLRFCFAPLSRVFYSGYFARRNYMVPAELSSTTRTEP
jgi:hypothetical protein